VSGYTHCGCRDCFEIAISGLDHGPALCADCESAGCSAAGDCDCEHVDHEALLEEYLAAVAAHVVRMNPAIGADDARAMAEEIACGDYTGTPRGMAERVVAAFHDNG